MKILRYLIKSILLLISLPCVVGFGIGFGFAVLFGFLLVLLTQGFDWCKTINK